MSKLSSIMPIVLLLEFFLVGTGFGLDTVTVTGSTTVMPFVEICAEEFNMMGYDIVVSVAGVGGSGVGVKNVAMGSSDVGMISREVRPEEIEIYGDNFSEVLIAYDAICIAVSRSIYDAGVTNLTQDLVKAIYEGDITNWKDLGGPDREIFAVARLQGSGTGDLFNELVMGDLATEASGVDVNVLSNAEMKTAITASDKAIGYLGLNYVQEGNLSSVAYEGVSPSIESIENRTYSLSRSLHLITWNEPDESEGTFLDFVLGDEGQKIAEDVGFVSVRQMAG